MNGKVISIGFTQTEKCLNCDIMKFCEESDRQVCKDKRLLREIAKGGLNCFGTFDPFHEVCPGCMYAEVCRKDSIFCRKTAEKWRKRNSKMKLISPVRPI